MVEKEITRIDQSWSPEEVNYGNHERDLPVS